MVVHFSLAGVESEREGEGAWPSPVLSKATLRVLLPLQRMWKWAEEMRGQMVVLLAKDRARRVRVEEEEEERRATLSPAFSVLFFPFRSLMAHDPTHSVPPPRLTRTLAHPRTFSPSPAALLLLLCYRLLHSQGLLFFSLLLQKRGQDLREKKTPRVPAIRASRNDSVGARESLAQLCGERGGEKEGKVEERERKRRKKGIRSERGERVGKERERRQC